MTALVTCFSTLGCPDLSVVAALDLARRHAIPMVEIRAVSGSTDLVAALTAEFGNPAGFAAAVRAAGIAVPVLGTSERLFEAAFDHDSLLRLDPWARAAGVRFLRVFDGGQPDAPVDLPRAADRLARWRARPGADAGPDLIVETHDALVDHGVLARFRETLPDAPVLWDTHHTWAAGTDLTETVSLLGASVAHLHVKDSLPEKAGRRYVLPGQGYFPIGALKTLLQQPDLRGVPVSLEWEKLWHPDLPDLAPALAAAADGWAD